MVVMCTCCGHCTSIKFLTTTCTYIILCILPVISSIEDISSVDVMAFTTSSQTNSTCDYATGINNRLATLERRLKALEHVRILLLL